MKKRSKKLFSVAFSWVLHEEAPVLAEVCTSFAAMIARGESQTNLERAGAMTEEELEASIAADPDEAGMPVDWSSATIEMPQPKAVLNMRVDPDVLAFFKQTGKGYQTRINAVLRAFVDAQQRRAG